MPKTPPDRRVRPVFACLLKHFGPQHWWPADTPWEMMVGALLTQNTAWTNVEKTLTSLKEARALSIRSMATMPRSRLAQLIRSSGYFRQKAKRLQGFARVMREDPMFFRALTRGSPFGRPCPLPPEGEGGRRPGEGLSHLRQRLLSLHGIGPETADSILLYAGGYPVFVVDAYTRRIGQRMGLFKTEDYQEVQAFFQERCAPAIYNEFHALIVMLGKGFCTSRHPKCAQCPVSRLCERRIPSCQL